MPRRHVRGQGIVHLIDRALDRRPIFKDTKHKVMMIKFMREAVLKFGVDVYSYVLMDNHLHIIAYGRMTAVSKMMQSLKFRFVVAYNRSEGRRGPLFEGRFLCHPIRTVEYALDRSFYVHLNPVTALKCTRPERYRWSSAAAYVGAARLPSWVNASPLWSLLSRQRNEAQSKYAEAMASFAKDANGASPAFDEFPGSE